MAHTDSGGQGGSLDDEQREFLRQCAESPAEVDVAAIFERLDSEEATEEEQGTRHLGARALTQYAGADPAGLAAHGDRIAGYLDDEDENVRKSAIVAVQRLVESEYDAFTEPPVKALLARLGKEDQPGSKRVAETLARLLAADDPRLETAVDRTVDLFAGDEHEAGSGIQALSVLGDHFPGRVVDRLTARLADENPTIRKYAVRTLATLSEDNAARLATATPDLLALVDDADDYTREHAMETLTDVAAAEPTALEAAVPRLTELVDDDHDKVRRGAVRVLAELGRADVDVGEAVDTLRGRLDDDDKIVRRDACYALGILRAEAALADIRAREDSYDPEFAAVAASAIERIEDGESDPPMTDLEPGEIFTARL
jgi:HEAT repeat protein